MDFQPADHYHLWSQHFQQLAHFQPAPCAMPAQPLIMPYGPNPYFHPPLCWYSGVQPYLQVPFDDKAHGRPEPFQESVPNTSLLTMTHPNKQDPRRQKLTNIPAEDAEQKERAQEQSSPDIEPALEDESETSHDQDSATSRYSKSDITIRVKGPHKRAVWRPGFTKKEVLRSFRRILYEESPSVAPEDLTKVFEAELSNKVRNDLISTFGKYNEQLLGSELAFAKKNMTLHFKRILLLAVSVYRAEERVHTRKDLDKLQSTLKKMPARISAVKQIYKRPEFQFFVEFLKSRVLLQRNLPKLIMALNIKSTEKLVMLPLVPNYIRFVNHPDEQSSGWRRDTKDSHQQTQQLVEAVRQGSLSYEEVMKEFAGIEEHCLFSKPSKRAGSKFGSLSYRWKGLLLKLASEAAERCSLKEEKETLQQLRASTVPTTLEGIRGLLKLKPLRKYLIEDCIPNSRMILEILENSSLSLRTKTSMLECYPKVVCAVQNPETLTSWQG